VSEKVDLSSKNNDKLGIQNLRQAILTSVET
jgi:hypothetical protein